MSRMYVLITVAAALCFVLFAGCESDAVTAEAGEGVVSGTVYDGVTRLPLATVRVRALSVSSGTVQDTTDTDGFYVLRFTVDSVMTVSVTFSKTGYNDTTITASLRSAVVTPADIYLTPKGGVI